MLIFGDAITEAKYLRELRAAVEAEVNETTSRMNETTSRKVARVTKKILKAHGRFAPMQDLVELTVEECLRAQGPTDEGTDTNA